MPKGIYVRTEKARENMSLAQKGNKNWLGKHHSEKSKNKMRKYHLGTHLSEETKRKISRANKGKKRIFTEEHKKNLSLSHPDYNWEKHPYWKGDKAKYSALHRRVEIKRGKPSFCEVCKTTDKNKRYEWANLTKKYEDVMDYKRMCHKCHRGYDSKGKVTIKCNICNKLFKVWECRKNTAKYCSLKCRNKSFNNNQKEN